MVICEIMGTTVPIEAELVLCFAATEPVKSEPNHLGFTLDYGVMEKSGSSRIVGLDRCFRLGPSHFLERCAQGDDFSGRDVEGGEFRFGRGRDDKFDDLGDAKDGSVGSGDRVIVGEEDVGAGATACIVLREEAGIGVRGE